MHMQIAVVNTAAFHIHSIISHILAKNIGYIQSGTQMQLVQCTGSSL